MQPLVADLVDVHAEGARTIAGVGPDQWGLPTVCDGWSVADVVRHQVLGHRVFVALLAGESVDRIGWDAELREREVPELPTMFVESARDLERAFEAPGAMQKVVTLPIGEIPGEAAIHLRLAETMVHGWDVARATGQEPHFTTAIVERELEVSRVLLQRIPEGSPAFGPSVAVADDAPALDRLAGLLGRDPRA